MFKLEEVDLDNKLEKILCLVVLKCISQGIPSLCKFYEFWYFNQSSTNVGIFIQESECSQVHVYLTTGGMSQVEVGYTNCGIFKILTTVGIFIQEVY